MLLYFHCISGAPELWMWGAIASSCWLIDWLILDISCWSWQQSIGSQLTSDLLISHTRVMLSLVSARLAVNFAVQAWSSQQHSITIFVQVKKWYCLLTGTCVCVWTTCSESLHDSGMAESWTHNLSIMRPTSYSPARSINATHKRSHMAPSICMVPAFLKKHYGPSYKQKQNNVLRAAAVRFHEHFVSFSMHQTIWLHEYIFFCELIDKFTRCC